VAAIVVAVLALAPDLSRWISWIRYPIVITIVLLGCAGLYRPGGARGAAPPGAVVAAGTWVLGSVGLLAYVSWGPDLEAAYGAFGSVVVVMLWLWICGIALIAGAHLTAVLRDRAVLLAGAEP
jgi:membrane protein